MPMIRAMRLLNSIEAGTTGSEALQALLADAGRAGEFSSLLAMPGQARRLVNNPVSMATVMASSAAFGLLIASKAAVAEVVGNAQALATCIASPAALSAWVSSATCMKATWISDAGSDAVLDSGSARLAVYNSDVALAALQASPAQVQRLVELRAATLSNFSMGVLVPNGTKLILLRRHYGGVEVDSLCWGRGQVVAAAGNGPSGGGRQLDTGVIANGCIRGTYVSNKTYPSTSDHTANFVSAANGLNRRAMYDGEGGPKQLTLAYILV